MQAVNGRKRCSRAERCLNSNKISDGTLSVGDFNKNKNKKDGLSPYCRECDNFKNKKDYQENLEARLSKKQQYKAEHRVKHNARNAKYVKENPLSALDSRLKSQYGITSAERDSMFVKQEGICAICGTDDSGKNQYGPKRFPIDHNHVTGKVRGLLCDSCNKGLGFLRVDTLGVELLQNSIEYIKQTEYKLNIKVLNK
jgi:hypothetical protein